MSARHPSSTRRTFRRTRWRSHTAVSSPVSAGRDGSRTTIRAAGLSSCRTTSSSPASTSASVCGTTGSTWASRCSTPTLSGAGKPLWANTIPTRPIPVRQHPSGSRTDHSSPSSYADSSVRDWRSATRSRGARCSISTTDTSSSIPSVTSSSGIPSARPPSRTTMSATLR